MSEIGRAWRIPKDDPLLANLRMAEQARAYPGVQLSPEVRIILVWRRQRRRRRD